MKHKMLMKNSNLQLIYFDFIKLVGIDKGWRKYETVSRSHFLNLKQKDKESLKLLDFKAMWNL